MRRLLIISGLSVLLASPVAAEETEEAPGTTLMERGAQMFLEGIMREMEPALNDLQGLAQDMGPMMQQFVDEMGPAFGELLGQIDDLSNYHAPEILPNGDIIIRRKTPEEQIEPEGEIEI